MNHHTVGGTFAPFPLVSISEIANLAGVIRQQNTMFTRQGTQTD